jgi:transposase
MGARLRAYLSPEEDRTLFELRRASSVPQRVKDRAEVVRLSHQGWYVEKIAVFFAWNPQTVRETLHRWQKQGLGGLFEASGRGQQRRWGEADLEYLEGCLRQEERSYSARQLADKLAQERQVKLSPGHLREVLKKRG